MAPNVAPNLRRSFRMSSPKLQDGLGEPILPSRLQLRQEVHVKMLDAATGLGTSPSTHD